MAKKKQIESVDDERTVKMINWIIRQATARNGTVSVQDGILSVSVPTTKPGGRGEEHLALSLSPSELGVFGNIEAISR